MSRSSQKRAPLIRCHPSIAAFLGAVPLADVQQARRIGPTSIPIRTSDGACWLWPIEAELQAAILRV